MTVGVPGGDPPLTSAVAAFADELAHWRQQRGLSKKQLAAQMGFDPSYVSHIEGRRHRPTEDFAKRAEAVLLTGGALVARYARYDELRQARRAGLAGATAPEHWLPPGAGLVVEREVASLTYADNVYTCAIRRELVNAGPEPVTRFPIKISVDRYPRDAQRSNELYRRHPVTLDELGLRALWCDTEPMSVSTLHDRDASKELWLHFENPQTRFPLYRGQRAVIEYRYELGEDKWGPWFARAIRLPTWHLAIRLDFPARLRPTVSGMMTSLTGDQPLSTPIAQHPTDDGQRLIFEWSTANPPLNARYRLDWRFPAAAGRTVPALAGPADGSPAGQPGPAQRMAGAGIRQDDDPLLHQRARPFVLPAEQAAARDVVQRLRTALDTVTTLHDFGKGVGLAAPQLGLPRRRHRTAPAR